MEYRGRDGDVSAGKEGDHSSSGLPPTHFISLFNSFVLLPSIVFHFLSSYLSHPLLLSFLPVFPNFLNNGCLKKKKIPHFIICLTSAFL